MPIVRPSSAIQTPWWFTFPNASNYTVAGTEPVWGDDSDATHVQFAGATLSPMPTAVFPATATDQDPRTVFVRCQAVSGSVYVGWELRNIATGELFSQHAGADVLAPGAITTLEIPSDAVNGTSTAALNAGNLAVTIESMGGTGTLRIFDAWIVIPFGCGSDLLPGAVTKWIAGSTYEPVIVGDPPQWADNSDATYADLQTVGDGATFSATKQTYAQAPLPATPDLATKDPTQVAFDLTVRYKANTTSPGVFSIGSIITSNGDTFMGIDQWTGIVTDDTIQTSTYTLTQDDFDGNYVTPADLLTLLSGSNAGLRFRVNLDNGSGTRNLRIYEAKLRVSYPCAVATHAPPLRQTRRNDGLRGSVRSLRATSRQRSLRRGPGTIL